MDPSHLAILLLILGLALLVAEFFVPSGGMITVMAVVSIVSSVWFAWKAWGTTSPGLWWGFLTVLVISLPTTLGGMLFLLSNTRLGNRVLLKAPDLEEVTPYQREQQRLQQLIGKTGRTLTLLNPGGMVLVEGERIHSETPGLMLEADTAVEVIAVKGTRVVVRPASLSSPPSPPDTTSESAWLPEEAEKPRDNDSRSPPKPSDERLDFDLGGG
ncbi:MAG: hypothetical protein IT428_09505 [Planctomycetaceae bacterium]|nr:hypothetical protein [Planctomycetaceae bacterium]